jgi:hypothetical protein
MAFTMNELRALAKNWIDAWNTRDLDHIMEFYASDVEFESDAVITRWGKPDGRLVGRDELQEHISRGLTLAPHARLDLEEVFSAPSGYAVLYRMEGGDRTIEVIELDRYGKARKVKALYPIEAT